MVCDLSVRASDVSGPDVSVSEPDVKVPAPEVGASASVPGVSVSEPDVKTGGEVDVKAPEMSSMDAKKPKGSFLGALIRRHSSKGKAEVRLMGVFSYCFCVLARSVIRCQNCKPPMPAPINEEH